ncbi:MAG: histidine kinase [Clostridiaceae bacterium]|nr:histidine kinase [Clostridiaceae bacterium]
MEWKTKLQFRGLLATKIAVVYFLVSIITILLVGIVSYERSRHIIMESNLRVAEAAGATIAASINNFFHGIDQTGISIYADKGLHQILNSDDPLIVRGNASTVYVQNLLVQAKVINPNVGTIDILGVNGFACSDGASLFKPYANFTECEARYIASGLQTEIPGAIWLLGDNLHIDGGLRQTLTEVRYIRHIDSLDIIGIMVLNFHESKVARQFQSAGENPYLVDSDGTVISAYDKTLLGRPLPSVNLERLTEGNEKLFTQRDLVQGQEQYATFARIGTTGWYYVNIQSSESLFGDMLTLRTAIIGAILLATVVSPFLAGFFSRGLTSSVSRLTNSMQSAMEGNLTARFEIRGRDEINRIGAYMNDMLDKIREYTEYRTLVAVRQKDAELKLLQAQINPHLLYNTLDSVQYYIQIGDNELVARILHQMSQFFKISLSRGQEFIPLKHELELVKHYFDLQRLCRNKDIILLTQIDPELAELRIPKMTIQPIVENSIIHAFTAEYDTGTISITARRKTLPSGPGSISFVADDIFADSAGGSTVVEIIVCDDGCGLMPEEVEQINCQINMDSPAPPLHFGLWNVNQRIKHTYGPAAQLTVSSEFGVYTQTTIVFALYQGEDNRVSRNDS